MAFIKATSLSGEKQTRAPEFSEQYLFLLEFYIQKIEGDRLAKLNQMLYVPTCVNFQFLDFKDDELIITPVDPMFEPVAGIADDIEYFYSGKSIMFSVAHEIVINKLSEFKIKMTVKKNMLKDISPDILIGEAEIDMSKQFAALRKEMLHCWNQGKASPQLFQDDIPLFFKGDSIGSVTIFVRLSSYGQSVITEFNAPSENYKSSYIFKGSRNNQKGLIYKCRVINPREMDICDNSEEDLKKATHLNRYPCSPCGLSEGALPKSRDSRSKASLYECLDKSKGDFSLSGRGSDPCKRSAGETTRHGLIQTSRGMAQPCGKAVVLKVSGLLDVDKNKEPTVTVAEECKSTTPDCDPDHDVFILRIGKKGLVGPDEKSDLQLEMKTPKGPERRPPIRYETREAQTEEESNGGRKVKGGKGKKKKK